MYTSRRNRSLGAAVLGLLSGCAVGPDFHRPPAPPVERYSMAADPTATASARDSNQTFTAGAAVAAEWWGLFRSPAIDTMIRDAIDGNPGLEAANANLRASQDELRGGYGVFFPTVDATAGATRERYSPANVGEKAPSSLFNLFTLSASVSYALDAFGGQRRLVEELHAQVDVARANERATYLTLTANVVNTVIAAAAYRAQIEATQKLIDAQREQVALAKVQASAGTVPYSNVLSIQSQLASTEATIPQLRQKVIQSEDLLATLAGHAPAEWRPVPIRLADLTLPSDLPVSLPSDLVRQRPDILASEATAHAAAANIGVATAALLPSITLNGSLGAATNSTSTLFPANGKGWSAGATLAAPLFQGGTLWYRRKAAIDEYHQALALHRQTVLAAFAQVSDTLHALDHDAQVLAAEDEARGTAQEALTLIQANYRAGIATYLDVLNADVQLYQADISDIQATILRFQDTVALFAALGGGWWNSPPADTGIPAPRPLPANTGVNP